MFAVLGSPRYTIYSTESPHSHGLFKSASASMGGSGGGGGMLSSLLSLLSSSRAHGAHGHMSLIYIHTHITIQCIDTSFYHTIVYYSISTIEYCSQTFYIQYEIGTISADTQAHTTDTQISRAVGSAFLVRCIVYYILHIVMVSIYIFRCVHIKL